MALVFWSSTGLKLRPELVLLMGEGIDPLSVLRVDRPCTSNIQDPLNTVIDGQNPGDIVLRFWISWMNYVELTTVFTTPCGAESCPSNVWQPNTFWHWAEEFRSCVKKTLIQRDFRLDLSTSHYLFVFLCGYIPETLHFAVFMCFVFFADHWLCWGVGGHRTVGIYTEARVPPVDPVERCLPTPGGFIRFHGKDEIMCQFECLKHRIQQHRSITFTWSSSMDHATYAIMMKCFFRMDVSGLRQMQLMAVLGSLAKWWRQTIKTDQSILVSRTATDPVTSLERVCYLLNALWNAELFQHGDYGNIHPDPLAGTKECFRPTTKKMRHCGSR